MIGEAAFVAVGVMFAAVFLIGIAVIHHDTKKDLEEERISRRLGKK